MTWVWIVAMVVIAGCVLQFALFLLPNVIWVLISLGVLLCGLAGLAVSAGLLVRLILRFFKGADQRELKTAAKQFLLAAAATGAVILLNNHVMPVIGYWIQEASTVFVR